MEGKKDYEGKKRIVRRPIQVFAEIGVQVNYSEARELFRHAGAEVEESSRVVKVPSDLVQKLISKAPSMVTLCGRAENGELDCEIGGDKVYMETQTYHTNETRLHRE